MHSRHRSPGGGVRSNLAEHARVSPEGSVRGHGLYDSDYRSFNRSYGRGSIPKPYPPPPHRRGDIFMEAGRLATEYLVSQGLLSPNVLPKKWKNGNYADIRGNDRDNPPSSSEGRTSALARLGNIAEAGSRRRFHDEFGWRHQMKGRRRSESLRGYGSDWGRNGSWSEKSKGFSSTMDGEEDYAGGHRGERVRGHDSGNSTQRTVIDEPPSKNGVADDMDSELDTYDFPADGDSKEKCFSAAEELPAEAEKDVKAGLDDAESLNLEAGEVKNSTYEDESVQQGNSDKHTSSNDLDMQDDSVELGKENRLEDDHENRPCNDLKSFCSFGKVPTRARSSLASKVTKPDDTPSGDEEKAPDMASAGEIVSTKEEAPVESSLSDTLTNQTLGLSSLSSGIAGISSLQSLEEPGDLDTVYVLEKERCARSQSFSDQSSFVQNKQVHQGPPGFTRSRSAIVTGEEERLVLSIVSGEEGKKRPREWDPQSDDFFGPQNLRLKPSIDEVPGDEVMVNAVDHESKVKPPMFPENKAEHSVEARKEKQLMPGSFKICDLNLSEASDISESPRNVVLSQESAGPSSLRPDNVAPVDVGLSISNRFEGNFEVCSGPSISNNPKEIIVVDVDDDDDDDLVIQDRAFSNSEKKSDTIYSSLENFLHTENNVDLPDVQSGYGLVSELLGNDISNCSQVPADLHNDLDNEIALHNQEVIPGDDDDDPIYLSLGEIPLSFMGMWDQPNQEYGKSF